MVLAQDLVTVDGIPAHPLVVHAVVVLLPLAALCALLIAVRPAWRRRYDVPVLALTAAGVAAVPVAQHTGRQLRARLASLRNPLIAEHADRGETMLPFALVFGIAVLVFVVLGRVADRNAPAASGPGATVALRRVWTWAVVAAAVLVVLSGVATTAQVIRTGHTGSVAVWDGVGENP